MSGLTLNKGQSLTLNKENIPTAFIVGLGWDVNKADNNADFDCDVSVVLTDKNDKVLSTTDWSSLIFYGNLKGPGIEHQGDNRTGDGEGDDEQVFINLSEIDPNVHNLNVAVSIHLAKARKQNFGQIKNAYVRLVDPVTNKEHLRFDLNEDFSLETGVLFAKIYRHNNEWKFRAIADGFNNGLSSILKDFGLIVPEETA